VFKKIRRVQNSKIVSQTKAIQVTFQKLIWV